MSKLNYFDQKIVSFIENINK